MAVLENGKLQINKPNQVKLEPTLVDRIQENKSAIINFLGSSDETQIAAVDRNKKHFPLSYQQERSLQFDRLEGYASNHLPTLCKITGALDVSVLQNAYANVINQHEVLRTVYQHNEGTPYQEILPQEDWGFDVLDFCRASSGEIMAFLTRESRRSFKLEKGPSIRAILVKSDVNCHYFSLVVHNISADRSSIPVFCNDLIQHYEALLTGKALDTVPLNLQYVDYACWQREKWDRETIDNKLGFWYNKLSGYAPLQLNDNSLSPVDTRKQGSVIDQKISKEVRDRVIQRCLDHDVTLYMYLLAAYKILLYQYTGESDLIVGSPVSNQQNEGTVSLIGDFVNTLPLRSEIDPSNSFTDFLSEICETVMCAVQNQEVPIEKIITGVEDIQDITESALIQTILVLDHAPEANVQEVGGVKFEWETIATVSDKSDLTFTVVQKANELIVNVNYSKKLFSDETIIGLINHLENILNAVTENPEIAVSEVPLMMVGESEEVLAL